MQIFVNMGAGRMIALDVEARSTINDVKAMIQMREGIPASEQRLIFAAKTLEGCRTISDCSIDRNFRPLYLVRQSPPMALIPFGSWGGA
mmetsp:Transcript_98730/g.302059  ORF Transcript_98730/g.302059 Transcript_98730/m.302059 type:complete len:89 (-) Transcript_98730:217-483(-)